MTDSSDPDSHRRRVRRPHRPPWAGPSLPGPTKPPTTDPAGRGRRPRRPSPRPTSPPADPFGPPPIGQGTPGPTPYADRLRPGPRPGPYGQLGPAQTPYGQQPYGSTAYGQQPYDLPPVRTGPPPKNGNALALTIVSASPRSCAACSASLAHPRDRWRCPSQSTDPQGSARLARWGLVRPRRRRPWIAVIATWAFIALAAAGSFDSGTYDYQGACAAVRPAEAPANQPTSSQLTGTGATLRA